MTRIYRMPTRRQVIVTTGSAIALAGFDSQTASSQWFEWLSRFTAGAAANWLTEALKGWGLMPDLKGQTSVQESHAQALNPIRQQGFDVRSRYSGSYSGGDFELSEATRDDEFKALSTTSHGNNTCTLSFDKADAASLGLVAMALRRKGFPTRDVQSTTFPIHPPSANRFVGSMRHSPKYMTPSGGTINWSTDLSSDRPNFLTSIRSSILSVDMRFAQLDRGGWTFDMHVAG